MKIEIKKAVVEFKSKDKYFEKEENGKKCNTARELTNEQIFEVDKNMKVYHRGRGRFATYSNARDKKRQSRGVNQISPRSKSYKVGKGSYRHTKDGKR